MSNSLYFDLLFKKLSDTDGYISKEMLNNICKHSTGFSFEEISSFYENWKINPQIWSFKSHPIDITATVQNIKKTENTKLDVETTKSPESSREIDPIMIIHVCDEPKSLKRDFQCPRRLLLEEMRYFADYLSGGQNSDDVDISVHCDVNIFDWLIRYVKRHHSSASDDGTDNAVVSVASLKPTNIISILISSDFLKMDSLVEECINYIHSNINALLSSSCNINCLNSSIIARIADKFSDMEVNAIIDKKDKIKSHLFKKKLELLFDPVQYRHALVHGPVSQLYKCKFCSRLLLGPHLDSAVACVDSQLCVSETGSLQYRHEPERIWRLEEELETWMRPLAGTSKGHMAGHLYWRLWACLVLARCERCNLVFPLPEIGHCRYHHDGGDAVFPNNDSQRIIPIVEGVYTCCGIKTLKFDPFRLNKKLTRLICQPTNTQHNTNHCNVHFIGVIYSMTLLMSNQGCRTRDHVVQLFNGPNNRSDSEAQLDKILDVIVQHRAIFAYPFTKRDDEKAIVTNIVGRDRQIMSGRAAEFKLNTETITGTLSQSKSINSPKQARDREQAPRLRPLLQCGRNVTGSRLAVSSPSGGLNNSAASGDGLASLSRPSRGRRDLEYNDEDEDEDGPGGEPGDSGGESELDPQSSRPMVTIKSEAILLDAPQFPVISNKKWDSNKSMRSNQDSQRQEDLRRTRQMVGYLTGLRKQIDKGSKSKPRQFSGGIYCYLEHRWKHELIEKVSNINSLAIQKSLSNTKIKQKLSSTAQPFK